jgi:threonine dehydrogenase-like Zn-dependent dehydrogenase
VVWLNSSRFRRIVSFRFLPKCRTFEGALVEPLANALHILSRIPNVRGATGLIYGAGPIGFLSAYAAREAGAARLIVVDRNPRRLEFASHFGADLVIDASKEDAVEVIRACTPNGQGVDFAIEAIGTDTCRRNAIACTAAGGTVACVGLDQEICAVDTRPLVIREVDVRGVYAYTRKEFAAAIEMLAAHRLHYDPWVTTASMDSGQRIFEELAGGQSPILKAIFLNNF